MGRPCEEREEGMRHERGRGEGEQGGEGRRHGSRSCAAQANPSQAGPIITAGRDAAAPLLLRLLLLPLPLLKGRQPPVRPGPDPPGIAPPPAQPCSLRQPREGLARAGSETVARRDGHRACMGRRGRRPTSGASAEGQAAWGRAPDNADGQRKQRAPEPAAVMACRYFLSCTSPAANTPARRKEHRARGADIRGGSRGAAQRRAARLQQAMEGSAAAAAAGRTRHAGGGGVGSRHNVLVFIQLQLKEREEYHRGAAQEAGLRASSRRALTARTKPAVAAPPAAPPAPLHPAQPCITHTHPNPAPGRPGMRWRARGR